MPKKKSNFSSLAPVSLIVFFSAFLGFQPAFSLSGDNNQHFSAATIANWTVGCNGCGVAGVIYGLNPSPQAAPVSDTSDSSPVSQGQLAASGGCPSCSVTVVYKDPAPTGVPPGSSYIELDAFTVGQSRQFQIIVMDTAGNAVTALNNDIIVNCSNPPATIQGSTLPNQWATLFIPVGSLTNPVSTVSAIIPTGQADNMSGNFVYFDNLQLATTLPCIIPPTNTFTDTPTNSPTVTPTSSPTDTFTKTPTGTFTMSPTNTPTNTPTVSPTQTFTKTPTSTPTDTATPTPPNTPTDTTTPANTLTSTSTATPVPSATSTFSPTTTGTPTSTLTATQTLTPTFSATSTSTLTPQFTSTFTPTATITSTPTKTNTPGPSPTSTPTSCPVVVYPDPMDFQHNPAYTNCVDCGGFSPSVQSLKFGCIPAVATLKIYTISLGGLVREFKPGDVNFHASATNPGVGTITWDGTNGAANPVAPGFYFYVVEGGPNGRSIGQFAISRSAVGP